MEKKIAPSEHKAQALRAVLPGPGAGQSGEEGVSRLVRLSTERIGQEGGEQEQATALGRGRSEGRGEKRRDRNGDENGTRKTGEGVLDVKVPQIRGWPEPYRSQGWGNVGHTRDVLKKLIGERDGGGRS